VDTVKGRHGSGWSPRSSGFKEDSRVGGRCGRPREGQSGRLRALVGDLLRFRTYVKPRSVRFARPRTRRGYDVSGAAVKRVFLIPRIVQRSRMNLAHWSGPFPPTGGERVVRSRGELPVVAGIPAGLAAPAVRVVKYWERKEGTARSKRPGRGGGS
jgi:hypothetical protein